MKDVIFIFLGIVGLLLWGGIIGMKYQESREHKYQTLYLEEKAKWKPSGFSITELKKSGGSTVVLNFPLDNPDRSYKMWFESCDIIYLVQAY